MREARRVDHRHDAVEPRQVAQREAALVAEGEGGGDRHRLGDAGRFHHEPVEPPLAGEPAHLAQQILAQGAADAAVAQLDEPLLAAAERPARADQPGIDVDLAHVVDDDREPAALAVGEQVGQERRLAGPEEAREQRDRKLRRHVPSAHYRYVI